MVLLLFGSDLPHQLEKGHDDILVTACLLALLKVEQGRHHAVLVAQDVETGSHVYRVLSEVKLLDDSLKVSLVGVLSLLFLEEVEELS